MPKTYDHIHKYKRIVLGGIRVVRIDGKRHIERSGGTEVFKCTHPGCSHYLPRELVVGREGRCWRCDCKLIMNMENTTLQKPTHTWCRKSKELTA